MKYMKLYQCDNCKFDLSISEGATKYRLDLICNRCPHDDSPTCDIYIIPPIDSDKHFCGLGCLKEWLQNK